MSASITPSPVASDLPWWKEPTKDQWYAYIAAWLGWTLDAFDFTIFLLIMVPIAQEFDVPLTAVTAVFTITCGCAWSGATAAGWMADRMGRKTPLMISILWYSICNFIAGFSPTFAFLFFFRALLGIGMGAEWPAGAALAMESWPARSRGFMSGILQGSWGLGFALSALAYGFLYDDIGWRGLLWIGILPALRRRVDPLLRQGAGSLGREPAAAAREEGRSARAAVHHLQAPAPLQHADGLPVDGARPSASTTRSGRCSRPTCRRICTGRRCMVATPLFWANIVVFAGSGLWGGVADKWGRRPAIIVPCIIAIFVTPLYLWTQDPTWIIAGLHPAGRVRRLDLRPEPELSLRALPDRGARHGVGLRLSSGRDLGRPGGAGADLLRRRDADGLRHADDGEHDRVPGASSSSPWRWDRRPRAST